MAQTIRSCCAIAMTCGLGFIVSPCAAQTASFTTPGAYSYTVPANTYSITVTISGGGGGGGGADAEGRGGNGAPGTAITARISVTPGQVISGVIGANGSNGYTSGAVGFSFAANCTGGGAGGAGYSAGGAGANTNCGNSGYSGGGGGGGGSSTLAVNGVILLQAAGGGGAAGGSWYAGGSTGSVNLGYTTASTCGSLGTGASGISLPLSSNNGDGSGGGGGGGGYVGGTAGASAPDRSIASSGTSGLSCISSSPLILSAATAVGNSGGTGATSSSATPLAPATPGSIAINPIAILTVTKTSSLLSDPVNGTSNPKLIPGAMVRYCILLTNNGPATVTNAAINDPLPPNVTFVPGSLANGTTCTSTSTSLVPGTGMTVSAGTVTASAATIAANTTLAFVFNAAVK